MPQPITHRQPRGLMRLLARAPIWLYRLRLGWLLGHRFLLLTHTGRVTGLKRQVVIEAVRHDPETQTVIVAAAWGERSDWYRNIRKTPEVVVTIGRQRIKARAERLPSEEATRELQDYARRNPRAAVALARMMGHSLERPEEMGALGSHIPIVALRPLEPVA